MLELEQRPWRVVDFTGLSCTSEPGRRAINGFAILMPAIA